MTVPEAEEVDLSTMTFDERLDYLAALEQEKPIPPEDPDNDDLFGVDDSLPEAQFWTLDFWRLIVEDLKTIEWPTRTQSLQTVVSSQVSASHPSHRPCPHPCARPPRRTVPSPCRLTVRPVRRVLRLRLL